MGLYRIARRLNVTPGVLEGFIGVEVETDRPVVAKRVSGAWRPAVAGALGSFLVGSSGTNSIGLVWVPEADVAHLAAAGAEPVFYHMDLKLADPAAAPAFADRYASSPPESSTGGTTSPITLTLNSWQSIRSKDTLVTARAQLVLVTGSWLLVLLALASVVVLVGGRVAEQTRRVGLLKAIGGACDIGGVHGIVYRENGAVSSTGRARVVDLDRYPPFAARRRPARNSKREVCRSYTLTPVTSLGSRSGVNCTRAKRQATERARVLARSVLPTPG